MLGHRAQGGHSTFVSRALAAAERSGQVVKLTGRHQGNLLEKVQPYHYGHMQRGVSTGGASCKQLIFATEAVDVGSAHSSLEPAEPKAPCSCIVCTWALKGLPYHKLRLYGCTIKLHGAF